MLPLYIHILTQNSCQTYNAARRKAPDYLHTLSSVPARRTRHAAGAARRAAAASRTAKYPARRPPRSIADARRGHVELAGAEAGGLEVDADALERLPLRLVDREPEADAHLRAVGRRWAKGRRAARWRGGGFMRGTPDNAPGTTPTGRRPPPGSAGCAGSRRCRPGARHAALLRATGTAACGRSGRLLRRRRRRVRAGTRGTRRGRARVLWVVVGVRRQRFEHARLCGARRANGVASASGIAADARRRRWRRFEGQRRTRRERAVGGHALRAAGARGPR